jgi:hypothetical protein
LYGSARLGIWNKNVNMDAVITGGISIATSTNFPQ